MSFFSESAEAAPAEVAPEVPATAEETKEEKVSRIAVAMASV
jgi:hypothetical protein